MARPSSLPVVAICPPTGFTGLRRCAKDLRGRLSTVTTMCRTRLSRWKNRASASLAQQARERLPHRRVAGVERGQRLRGRASVRDFRDGIVLGRRGRGNGGGTRLSRRRRRRRRAPTARGTTRPRRPPARRPLPARCESVPSLPPPEVHVVVRGRGSRPGSRARRNRQENAAFFDSSSSQRASRRVSSASMASWRALSDFRSAVRSW